jgi:hypothetical protein
MDRWARLIRRFLRQSAERRRLLLEAWLYLIGARLMLRFLPFLRLKNFFDRPGSRHIELVESERERVRQNVRWSIERAAGCLPGNTSCFPLGIAAQAMCRKRGVGATLYYGAAILPEKGLSAHVWVLDGTQGIVGHRIASEYRIIARFPG